MSDLSDVTKAMRASLTDTERAVLDSRMSRGVSLRDELRGATVKGAIVQVRMVCDGLNDVMFYMRRGRLAYLPAVAVALGILHQNGLISGQWVAACASPQRRVTFAFEDVEDAGEHAVVDCQPTTEDTVTNAVHGRLHVLRTWTTEFQAVLSGEKTFEFRQNDRDFRVGDRLELMEWDNVADRPTGNTLRRTVTYVLHGPEFGVPRHFVVMSIAEVAG